MTARGYLGEFEQIVMLAVARLDEEGYGMSIRREIERTAGRPVSIGAVYATLERLEAKGLVSTAVGESTPVRGGRPKRFYTVQPAGRRALLLSRRALDRMWDGLDWELDEGV